jgi:L-seryl-tRNA(Ser) seleniumtransferase
MLQFLRATLSNVLFERWEAIPTIRMIRQSSDEIRLRAVRVAAELKAFEPRLIDGESLVGGGSTPDQAIPTTLIAIVPDDPARFERLARMGEPPVIARIENGQILLDLRTVFPEQEHQLVRALWNAWADREPQSAADRPCPTEHPNGKRTLVQGGQVNSEGLLQDSVGTL